MSCHRSTSANESSASRRREADGVQLCGASAHLLQPVAAAVVLNRRLSHFAGTDKRHVISSNLMLASFYAYQNS